MSLKKKIFGTPKPVEKTPMELLLINNTFGLGGVHKEQVALLENANVHTCELEGKHEFGRNTDIYACSIGLATYIAHHSVFKYTKVGRFCSIGEYVRTYLGIHPVSKFVSAHPLFYSSQDIVGETFTDTNLFPEHNFLNEKYVVEIGNDVWIGNNVMIMDGLRIGDGAVIAAGSIVTKDVAPYSVVAGTPARHSKFRFTEEQIKFLLEFKWWEKDFSWIKENFMKFSDIEAFMNTYK